MSPAVRTGSGTADRGGTCAQVLLWTGGRELTTQEVPLPAPGPGEILVRVRAAAICGSDLHTVAGHRQAPCPSVLGHEGTGEILDIGPDGSARPRDAAGAALHAGDRIIWSVVAACRRCDRCAAGLSAKCRGLRKAGHEPFAGPWPLSGALATHVLLPAGHDVMRIPPALDEAAASTAACAGATVMAALEAAAAPAVRGGRGEGLDGARVLVIGAGMLGLLATCGARQLGARTVHVLDPSPERRSLARAAGATSTAAPGPDASCQGFDAALELSGSAAGVSAAVAALDVGGTAVLAGSVFPGPAVAVDPEQLVRGLRTVTGVHNYEPRHLVQAVELLASPAGRALPWREIMSPPVTLDGAAAALRDGPGSHLRTLVRP